MPPRPVRAAQGNPADISVTVTVLPETPPDAISNLTALTGSEEGDVRLNWTSPGDDGALGDLGGKFYIRRSTDPIASFTIPPDAANIVIATSAVTQSAQSYVVQSLEPGATFYFAMLAEDDLGKRSSWSTAGGANSANFAAALDLPPDTPSNFQVAAGDGQTALSWNAAAAADLDLYRVYVDSTSPHDFADAFTVSVDSTGVSFNHTGLTNFTTYAYRLAAVDKGSPDFPGVALESAFAGPISIQPAAPPAAISNLTALATSQEGELQLSWTAPGASGTTGTAASYVVKYSTSQITAALFDAAATATQAWTPLPAGSTETRIVSGLTPQTTLYFAIKARNINGTPGAWNSPLDDPTVNTANSVAALEILPAAITDLAASPGTAQGSMVLTWTAPGDDAASGTLNGRYRIDYSTNAAAAHLLDPSVFKVDFATSASPGEPQRTELTGLSPGGTYYVRVAAVDERSNVSLSNGATSQARVVLDTVQPRVIAFTPSSIWPGVMPADVRPNATVTVTFDEAMNPASLAGAFRVRAVLDRTGVEVDQAVGGALSVDGTNLTFVPGGSLRSNETYEITVTTAATDLAGNRLAAPLNERFRTVFSRSVENILVAPDGKTRVRIPANTLPEDGYLHVSLDPLNVSFASLGGLIREANDKARARRGGLAPLSESVREFQLISAETGQEMGASLQRPMELSLPYEPDANGFVQGPSYRIHERFLGTARLDEEAGLWTVVPGARLDRESKRIVVNVPHFSAYAVMPVATNFVGDAFAYPMPFVPSKGHTKITFTNLALETSIEIYTISGELVRELLENDGDGQMDWDAKNEEGADVFSGVYLYVVKSGSEKKVGRLVIIR